LDNKLFDLKTKFIHIIVTTGVIAVSVKSTIHKATSKIANTRLLCHLFRNIKTEKKISFYQKIP